MRHSQSNPPEAACVKRDPPTDRPVGLTLSGASGGAWTITALGPTVTVTTMRTVQLLGSRGWSPP